MNSENYIENVKLWIQAARPRTLPAAAAPVLVGLALAFNTTQFNYSSALACLLISLLMQIAANFANDLFDNIKGSDTPDRLGPVRVTSAGLISPGKMKIAVIVTIAAAALLGCYLIWIRGIPVLVLGLLVILAALLYTGGPFPYGYFALGDIFVFLSFGLAAVCGTYFVQAGNVSLTAIIASIPVGLLIVNILVVNNTRDINTDRTANKKTLAVVLGRNAMTAEYLICLLASYMVPVYMVLNKMSSIWVFLIFVSLPSAFIVARDFVSKTGRELNVTLAKTAQLALFYSLLFAAGILLFP